MITLDMNIQYDFQSRGTDALLEGQCLSFATSKKYSSLGDLIVL